MNKQTRLKLWMEASWLVVTLLIVVIIFYPIKSAFNKYLFFTQNLVFILIFITYARYIFLLPHTFLAKRKWLKVFLAITSIPLVFYLVSQLHYIQVFLDEQGQEALFAPEYLKEKLNSMKQTQLLSFIKTEILLFAVGSIIVAIMFPFRMIISVWRQVNKGTE